MSELPKGWSQIKLSDIAMLRTGPFGSSLHQSDYVTDGVPLINPMHIARGQLVPSSDTTVSVDTAERLSEFRLKSSDIVIGRRGEMGRCAVVRPQAEGWLCGTGSLIIRPLHGRLSSDFLQYFLAHDRVVRYLMSASVGSTMANLNQQLLLDLDVCIPPAAEQTRIVAKLEELLSDLDAGVAELKAAQKKLQQYRQSLLKAAVEGALTASWRETQRTTNAPFETGAELLERILRERRGRWEEKQLAKFKEQGKIPPKDWQKKYPEPVVPDTNGLPELPSGWVWTSLDQLVAESSYGTSVKCNYESGGTPVLRIPNVSGGKLDLRDMKSSITELGIGELDHLAVGDVLVIRTNGSIGLVGRAAAVTCALPVPHYFASYLLRLRCIETTYIHRWIVAVLSAGAGRKWLEARAASSAGQHNISLSTLLTMSIPLPPLEEQARILNAIEDGQETIEQQSKAFEMSLKQSTFQRQNILRAAFSGQLVPQDPNDEPASVLLERIRSERTAQAATKKPRGRKKGEAAA